MLIKSKQLGRCRIQESIIINKHEEALCYGATPLLHCYIGEYRDRDCDQAGGAACYLIALHRVVDMRYATRDMRYPCPGVLPNE